MQTKNLNVTPNGVMPRVNASQYDNGREVHFLLYDGTTPFIPPSGSMIRVEGAKSDGNGFSYECSYTDNNVTVIIREQMTVLAEDVECELRISKDLTDIGTINFILAVEKGALPSDIPISDTEIPAIIELAKDEQYNSEAWARGTRNGVSVSSDDPAYHNNAKWYAEHSSVSSLDSLSDVTITNPQNGQGLVYDENSDEWINGTVSGGGGSTIKITTSESSLYGMPVSISDGTTTLTGTFSNSGAVTFVGVTMTGSLAIECDGYINTVSAPYFGNYEFIFSTFGFTLNVYAPVEAELSVTATGETYTDIGAGSTPVAFILHQPSTTYTITATIDGISKSDSVTTPSTSGGSTSKTIEFGTINVTLDADFIGETITCVNGGTTISKTASTTSLVFYPPTTGTWSISGTVSGTTYSVDAEVVSLSTPVSVVLQTTPEGSTVLPTDDIQTWLACAGITDKSYTTLNEVLADSTTLLALISDNNASDYLVRSTTWASGITADSTAMTDIGANNYCANILLADSTWLDAICDSTYFESVLNTKVPTMTSNTTPSGECFQDGSVQVQPYNAFSSSVPSTTSWTSTQNDSSAGIGYKFTESTKVSKMTISYVKYGSNPGALNYPLVFRLQGSNDGSTYTDISSDLTILTPSTSSQTANFEITNNSDYLYYKLKFSTAIHVSGAICAMVIQFYGRTDV